MRPVRGCPASFVVLLAAFTLALAPASVPASVTIGPDLSAVTPFNGYNCSATKDCTVATIGLGTIPPAAGGFTSPVNGAIVSATGDSGGTASDVTLRVLRPTSMGAFTGAGTSAGDLVFPANATTTVPLSSPLPIRAGDIIGVQCCLAGDDSITSNIVAGSGAAFGTWGTVANPVLGDGQTAAPDGTNDDVVVALNATIEPSNTFTIDAASIAKRSVTVGVTVPNPGTVTVGGGSPPVTVPQTLDVAAGATSIVLQIDPAAIKPPKAKKAKKGKRKKAKPRTLRFTVPVTYTPRFGAAASLDTPVLTLKAKKTKKKKKGKPKA